MSGRGNGSCIPFKYISCVGSSDGTSEKDVEVLMINSTRGPGLLFPKVSRKVVNFFVFLVYYVHAQRFCFNGNLVILFLLYLGTTGLLLILKSF